MVFDDLGVILIIKVMTPLIATPIGVALMSAKGREKREKNEDEGEKRGRNGLG